MMLSQHSLFRRLIAPKTPEQFFDERFGKDFCYFAASEERNLSFLPSWDQINELLRSNRLSAPRLRAALKGAEPGELDFVEFISSRRSGDIPVIDPKRLYEVLNRGATLVIDAVNESFEQLAELNAELAQHTYSFVQTNAYICFKDVEGFGLHWDDHDVFVVQIAGSKDWKIFAPTRDYPLFRDFEEGHLPTEVSFEGTLKPGDVLYVPRGHWHNVTGNNEPCFHLTIGVTRPNFDDFIRWTSDQLLENAMVRKDIEFSEKELEKQVQELRHLVNSEITTEKIASFLAHRASKMRSIQKVSLPFVPNASPLESNDLIIELNSQALGDYTFGDIRNQSAFTFVALGRSWTFAAKTKLFFDKLVSERKSTLSEAKTLIPGASSEDIHSLVRTLVEEGLVAVRYS